MGSLEHVVYVAQTLGKHGLWYLATPYAKYPFGKDTAARHASKLAAALISRDVAVFCPIAHGHAIQQQGCVQGHDVWLPLDEKFMAFCCGIIVARMPGYHYSKGVEHETKWFQAKGLPIIHLDVVDILGIPEIFNDQNLSDEAEAKIMGEKQPLPQTVVGVDHGKPGGDHTAVWVRGTDGTSRPATAEEYEAVNEVGIVDCGDPDCEMCGAQAVDPREAHGYRKDRPVTTGVLDYFPLAMAEVARISKLGNAQHNLGDKHLHWERTKSTDHADCIGRHLSDRGGYGLDGAAHSGNLAWRALALLQTDEEERLIGLGIRPEKVFSRAHTFHGKTAEEFWGPVPRPKDWATRPESWIDAANEYWDAHRDHSDEQGSEATATQWSEAEIAAMTQGRAPSEAFKFNRIPVTTMEPKAHDWTAQVERHERVCNTPDEVREKALKERERLRAQRSEVGQVLYKPARLYVYTNEGYFERVPNAYSDTAVERTVVRDDGLDYQGVVRS